MTREGRVFQNSDYPDRGTSPGASTPWSSVLALIGFVGLCLLVGVVAGFATAGSVRDWYHSLLAPPGRPPDWIFAPVWSALYVLLGVSGWLVWRIEGAGAKLRLWGWQLLANALWAPLFFGLHSIGGALVMILVLEMLILVMLQVFVRISRLAALLLVPYALWVGFAMYLNAGFWWLNS